MYCFCAEIDSNRAFSSFCLSDFRVLRSYCHLKIETETTKGVVRNSTEDGRDNYRSRGPIAQISGAPKTEERREEEIIKGILSGK